MPKVTAIPAIMGEFSPSNMFKAEKQKLATTGKLLYTLGIAPGVTLKVSASKEITVKHQ